MNTSRPFSRRLTTLLIAAVGPLIVLTSGHSVAQDVGPAGQVGKRWTDYSGRNYDSDPPQPSPNTEDIQRKKRTENVRAAENTGGEHLTNGRLNEARNSFEDALANCGDQACRTRLDNRIADVKRRILRKEQSAELKRGRERAAATARAGLNALTTQSGASTTLNSLRPSTATAPAGSKPSRRASAQGFAGASKPNPASTVGERRRGADKLPVIYPRVVKGEMTRVQAAAAHQREAAARAGVVIAALAVRQGNFAAALKHLENAEKMKPDDLGIKKAKGYVLHLRDRGTLPTSRKAVALLDAIEDSKGSWIKTVSILTDRHRSDPLNFGVRDALNFAEGMSGYTTKLPTGVVPLQSDPSAMNDPRTRKLVKDAISEIDNRHWDAAYRKLAAAHKVHPEHVGIRDTMNFIDGVAGAHLTR